MCLTKYASLLKVMNILTFSLPLRNIPLIVTHPLLAKCAWLEGSSYICWPVYGTVLHGDRCTAHCKVHRNFADESVCLMADNVWNEGKILTLWTAWQCYVSWWAVWFMCLNFFMICQQWVAVISSISHLFSLNAFGIQLLKFHATFFSYARILFLTYTIHFHFTGDNKN
jgi:hypothetical protein